MREDEEANPNDDGVGAGSESAASSDTRPTADAGPTGDAAPINEVTPTAARATLTEGPVARVLAGLAGPMVIGMFSVIAFNLTDTYFIARLGTRELAAISFTFPVVSVMFGIAMGLGTGTISVVSRAIGRGEQDRVRRFSTDSLLLSLLTVLVVAAIGVVQGRRMTACGINRRSSLSDRLRV